MARHIRFVPWLLAIACAFGAGAVAQNAPPGHEPPPGASAGSNQASSVERDPLRACMAAHPDDPKRLENCGWDGTYQPKR